MTIFYQIKSLIIRPGTFRYLPAVPSSNDIKLLDIEKTKKISGIWLQDIVTDIVNEQKNKSVITDDIQIVSNINELNTFYKNYTYSNDIFLGWAPRTKNRPEEVIFIIVCEHNTTDNNFIIKHLVQSPYWDSNQIESIYLKIALMEIVNIKNYSALDLRQLYKNNIRYYLGWELWYKNII
tara:strand:- start:472 stop:1011 length:540 start_codon:yes stop_codon:yes gene_type:complete